LATEALVRSATRTARLATRAASAALVAISRMEADISSVPIATVCTFRDTSSAAVATAAAWAEVSAAVVLN
jgi:hypothetical protein